MAFPSTSNSADAVEHPPAFSDHFPHDQDIYTCPSCSASCASYVEICAHLAQSDSECSVWAERFADVFLQRELNDEEDGGMLQYLSQR